MSRRHRHTVTRPTIRHRTVRVATGRPPAPGRATGADAARAASIATRREIDRALVWLRAC